jgi:hypothetical protein
MQFDLLIQSHCRATLHSNILRLLGRSHVTVGLAPTGKTDAWRGLVQALERLRHMTQAAARSLRLAYRSNICF